MRYFFLIPLFVCFFPLAKPGASHDYQLKNISIIHPWTPPSRGRARNAAVYVAISNDGAQTERLLAVTGAVARKMELHTHLNDKGIMRMRRLNSVVIPPNDTIFFEPGGLHIMLIGLENKLQSGETFPLTLSFKNAGSIKIEVKVMKNTN